MTRSRRTPAVAVLALVAGMLSVLGSVVGLAQPASAGHTPAPHRVTVMGSLMSELGCVGDWDESCDKTDLAPTAAPGIWDLVVDVPAGSYEWKVRLDGSWAENYGVDGKAGGANATFALAEKARLRFSYDHATHRISVEPADLGGPVDRADRRLAGDSLRADLTRERLYFVMADRFENGNPANDDAGLGSDRLVSGLDPTATGFYHGGDLQGVLKRLDYIEGLGTTAIWLTPSFKNKPVQGAPGAESAGYHGYWITDFTRIDPHLGTNADMTTLVKAAHARGIKVFFDIITNHTADVITYDKADFDPSGNLPYLSTADRPYRDSAGAPFDDRTYAAGDTFPEVNLDSFPYRPVVPAAEKDVKVPAWLNDPTLYHNRGVSTFAGESNTYGDFPSGAYSSLDDLWTENPRVVRGMTDIYKTWVDEVGIDGFRIDTVKHVNTEFWSKFSPALTDYAASRGNDDFFMFGEVYDSNPEFVSQYTTEGRLQATVDFGFQGSATGFAKGAATTGLRDFFASDDWYTDGDSNAYQLPTFLGNHDMGRIGSFLRQNPDGWDDSQLLARDRLAHSLMYLSRGQPVVYYGDEQGFSAPSGVAGGIGDQRAREDMFPSKVDLYNSFDLIGSDDTTAQSNFRTDRPLYRSIASLAALREAHPALADGAQIHRYASNKAGIYAFSRVDPHQRVEYVVAVNNATTAKSATFDTFAERATYRQLWPSTAHGRLHSDDEGRVTVTVPPLGVAVWKAERRIPRDRAVPMPAFASPSAGAVVGGRTEIGVDVLGDDFTQVTVAWRPVGATDWRVLGTDDNAPFRVFHDVRGLPKGTMVEYRTVAKDADGDLGAAQTYAFVGTPAKDGDPGGGPVTQPTSVSAAGSFNQAVGCSGDWQPECPVADLALDPKGQVWTKTFTGPETVPAGTYAYKAAINDSWDENYGAGGKRNGDNIELRADGGPITFWYSHATHWITNSIDTPHLYVAPGSFQSELGCPGDWDPSCMRSWLQDPDGDNVWTLRTEAIPPGTYESKVAQDFAWGAGNWGEGGISEGANLTWSVGKNEGVEFSFTPPDPSAPGQTAPLVSVTTYPATGPGDGSTQPDLGKQTAQWLDRGTVAWDLPAAARPGWRYRLYGAPQGGLELDAEAVTGGTSYPLTLDPAGLPPALRAKYPHLAGYDSLRLSRSAVRAARTLLTGQLAVAAFDGLGRLRAATGVQIPGVLDDVYADAGHRRLGVSWHDGRPTLSLWAPTAKDVDLRVWVGSTPTTVPMRRESDGTWTVVGPRSWQGAEYLYDVQVWSPAAGAVVRNQVTDPYSVGLTTNSTRSLMVDLSDPALRPPGWSSLRAPRIAQPEDRNVYELHIRDFSIGDRSVPAPERGTYLAFTHPDTAGMKHLRGLAAAGLNTVHLLPAFDIATIEERRDQQATPACDLASYAPDSTGQQACVGAVRARDGFNWGYDPYHYTTPEGSYATDPEGTARTVQFRRMVQGLNGAGLQVVMDVVYNHTADSGQAATSVLDKVVPGYYHRLSATGALETSTCCANTATEHTMMGKLMIDSVLTWARDYKVNGFRFDLMGHHSKQNMLDLRAALDKLTMRKDGVDGKAIYLYGEGWNFGEVADDARFVQASQLNLAGTGIGSFSDRLRDAVRGGGPFDADPRIQGFGSGLFTDPNDSPANGTPEKQVADLLHAEDLIKLGLAGNLADFSFRDSMGDPVLGREVDYNGQPAGYAADPSETVTYVDAHDNETLFDALQFKLPRATSMADRVRMNTLSLSTVALSQGVVFWHAGTDLLRSKSLDRNSFDSGDWFNRIDWTGQTNTFGSGLPLEGDNAAKWPYMRPLLADQALDPGPADMAAAHGGALDLLRVRMSTRLFRLGSAAAIQQKVSYLDAPPGVIAMLVDDTQGVDADPDLDGVLVVFNATPEAMTVNATGDGWALHPVQASGADPVVRTATAGADSVTVPARTTATFTR